MLDIEMLPAQALRGVFEDTAVAARNAHHEDLLVGQPGPFEQLIRQDVVRHLGV